MAGLGFTHKIGEKLAIGTVATCGTLLLCYSKGTKITDNLIVSASSTIALPILLIPARLPYLSRIGCFSLIRLFALEPFIVASGTILLAKKRFMGPENLIEIQRKDWKDVVKQRKQKYHDTF